MTVPTRSAHDLPLSGCETGIASDSSSSTGPRTPEGKAVSSQNATKHGCRSKTLILRHEDPAEYEALHKAWWDQYQPSGQALETLVQQLIDNHWFLLRATKRMEQVDAEMPENPCDWTDAHHKLLNNFTRYKTAAERAFQKSYRVVEVHLRDCARAQIDALKADLMRAKMEAQIARQSPPRKHTPLAEIKAQWEAQTGGFLGPLSSLSAAVVPPAEAPQSVRRVREEPPGPRITSSTSW
jgi:hypothetical protein